MQPGCLSGEFISAIYPSHNFLSNTELRDLVVGALVYGGFLEQAIDQMKVTFFFCHIFKLLGETGFTEQEILAIW